MMIDNFLAFNLVLLAALVSPGPAFLVAIRTALTDGRRAGIATGCGLAVMAATWTLLAVLGLEAVFRVFPWAYAVVKGAGAVYLLYIAWKTWAGAKTPLDATPRMGVRAFRAGVLANLANPKSVLFAGAVLLVIFPADIGAVAKGAVVLNHLLVEVLFYSTIAFVMASGSARRRYLAAKAALDRGTAVVLGALGLRLLLSR